MLTCKLTPIVAFSPVRKAAFNEERWRAVGRRQAQQVSRPNNGLPTETSLARARSEYDFIFSPGFLLNCLTSKLLRGTPRCAVPRGVPAGGTTAAICAFLREPRPCVSHQPGESAGIEGQA